MREGFEQDMQQYGALARAEQRSVNQFSDDLITEEVDALTRRFSQQHRTTIAAEQSVYALQRQKQEIVARLHVELRAVDDPEARREIPSTAWQVTEDVDGSFRASHGGQEVPVTAGDLMTDGDWGIAYDLDSAIDRRTRKRYVLERAKQQLGQLLDQQISATEVTSYKNDAWKRKAYESFMAQPERRAEQLGVVAEKMVRSFLEKLTYDYPDLDFTVERADTFQDVEEKIDFLIHRKSRTRAVDVEVPEKHAEGVQFTINPTKAVAQHKREQIARVLDDARRREHIDDIVLVSMPTQDFAETYETWKQWRQPGGPEKNWDPEVKESIFRNVLAGLFTAEELDAQWQRVAGTARSAA